MKPRFSREMELGGGGIDEQASDNTSGTLCRHAYIGDKQSNHLDGEQTIGGDAPLNALSAALDAGQFMVREEVIDPLGFRADGVGNELCVVGAQEIS